MPDNTALSDAARLLSPQLLQDARSARPYESLEPDELDELMATLEPLATLLLAAQD